mmetsp:Transcript_13314/g.28575  ORF Transcript_13314/g.28575 Transcript_13314/m.28575 type:complete len:244 (+) Transcript_13314:769-1500(+)
MHNGSLCQHLEGHGVQNDTFGFDLQIPLAPCPLVPSHLVPSHLAPCPCVPCLLVPLNGASFHLLPAQHRSYHHTYLLWKQWPHHEADPLPTFQKHLPLGHLSNADPPSYVAAYFHTAGVVQNHRDRHQHPSDPYAMPTSFQDSEHPYSDCRTDWSPKEGACHAVGKTQGSVRALGGPFPEMPHSNNLVPSPSGMGGQRHCTVDAVAGGAAADSQRDPFLLPSTVAVDNTVDAYPAGSFDSCLV